METYELPVTDRHTEQVGKTSGHVAQILRVAFFLNGHKEAVGTSVEDPDYVNRALQEAKKDLGLRDWGASENEFKQGVAVYRDWMVAAQDNPFEGRMPEGFDPMHRALNVFLTGLEEFEKNPAVRVKEMWRPGVERNPISWIREVFEHWSEPGGLEDEVADKESGIPNEDYLRLERALNVWEERSRERGPAMLHYLKLGESVLSPLFQRSLN